MINSLSYNSLGIFGDSYGDAYCNHITGDVVINSNLSHKFHWSKLLVDELNLEIINYSAGGSSLFYSFKQFLKNYHKHKANIFLVTLPARYTKPIKFIGGHYDFIPNLGNLSIRNSHELYDPSYSALEGFFLCQDMDFERMIHFLMIEKLLKIDPDVILVPCFGNSLTSEYMEENNINFNLTDWTIDTLKEKELNCPDHMKYCENPEIFAGHMIPEQNRIVADNFKNRILSGQWDWKTPNIKCNYTITDLWRKR